jgi:Holliday junction resolvase RusA-like endonuclease
MSRTTPRKADLTGREVAWTKTILGQPHSKANSRKLVHINGKTRFIKSDEALSYLTAFAMQCPTLDPLFLGDVHVELTIYYASRLPDLDESLILDAMQGRVYRNDRQVRKKTITGRVDRERPRTDIRVSLMEGSDRTGGA